MGFLSKIVRPIKKVVSPVVDFFSGGLGSTLLEGGLSFLGGERRNDQQVASAREQMAFQERLSSTAHQREIKDLAQAGLNPILSAKYGGSSSPGGAQAAIQDTVTPAVNTGYAAREKRALIRQTEANTAKVVKETELLDTQRELMIAQYHQTWNQGNYIMTQQALKELEMAQARNRRDVAITPYGQMMDYLNYGGSPAIGAAAGLAGASALGSRKLFQILKKYTSKGVPKRGPLFVPRHPLATQPAPWR